MKFKLSRGALAGDSVVTYYPLQRGDVFIVDSAVGNEHYSGAYAVSDCYGRIQLDSNDILRYCLESTKPKFP